MLIIIAKQRNPKLLLPTSKPSLFLSFHHLSSKLSLFHLLHHLSSKLLSETSESRFRSFCNMSDTQEPNKTFLEKLYKYWEDPVANYRGVKPTYPLSEEFIIENILTFHLYPEFNGPPPSEPTDGPTGSGPPGDGDPASTGGTMSGSANENPDSVENKTVPFGGDVSGDDVFDSRWESGEPFRPPPPGCERSVTDEELERAFGNFRGRRLRAAGESGFIAGPWGFVKQEGMPELLKQELFKQSQIQERDNESVAETSQADHSKNESEE
jgi:hypothetical protein